MSADKQGAPGKSELAAMIHGYYATQLLLVAVRLGIPDLLGKDPRTAAEIATALGADQRALRRFLRGLASAGITVEREPGAFALTPFGELLRQGGPGSLRDVVLLNGELHYKAFAELEHSVRTGASAFGKAHGEDFFSYLEERPEKRAWFDSTMVRVSQQSADALLHSIDFSRLRSVMDIGGGYGTLIARLLSAKKTLHGCILDREEAAPGARQYLEHAGVAERCSFAACDFFQVIPSGYDGYVLSQVLHDWGDANCVRLLRTCRRALGASGRLFIVEQLLPEVVRSQSRSVESDIYMLALFGGGGERTEAELRSLLATAELRVASIHKTGRGDWAIVEATL